MGTLATLAVVGVIGGAVAVASARPSRPDFDLDDRYVEPCDRGKTWKTITACLTKQGSYTVVYDTDAVKVVMLNAPPTGGTPRLKLYRPVDKGWANGNLSTFINNMSELLQVAPFATPMGMGVRVDVGTTMRSSVSLDQVTSKSAHLRRVFTTVCTPPSWMCTALVTSCDAYVRGKVYWTFRGEPTWHTTLGVRLRGDASRAGGVCKPLMSMLIEDPAAK